MDRKGKEKKLKNLKNCIIILFVLIFNIVNFTFGQEKLILSDAKLSFKVSEGESASYKVRITNTTNNDIYYSTFKTGQQENPAKLLANGEEELGSYWLTAKQNYSRTGYNQIESAVPPFSYKWKYTSQRVLHSPVVFGRNLYVPCEDGNVYLIDSRTGIFNERFSFTPPLLSLNLSNRYLVAVGKDEISTFDRSSKLFMWKIPNGSVEQYPVAINSDKLFFANGENISAYKLSDGSLIWKKEGSYTTVIASNEKITATSKNNILTCFNALNGNILYNLKVDGLIVDAPSISSELTYLTYIVQSEESYSKIISYDSNGNSVWGYEVNEIITASQSICEDYIIFGTVSGSVYALNRFNGNLLWKFETKSPIHISPTIAQDIVYIGCNNGIVYGINIRNGKEVWEADFGFPLYSEIVIAQGFIYTTDNTGALVAYGREWENVVPPSSPEGFRGYPGDSFVTLFWKVSTYEADLSGYNIYRKGPYETDFSFIEKLGIINNYQDKKVINGNQYNYLARAYDTFGNESANSGQVTITPNETWDPIWLKFNPTNGVIPKGSYVDLSIQVDASKVVAGFYSGYIYLIHSGDLENSKPLEIFISAEIQKKEIIKPLAPKILSVSASDKRVKIEWESTQNIIKSYKLFRSTVSKDEYQLIKELSQDTTSYIDENVRNKVKYYYALKSIDKNNNESDYSEEISVIPQPLPIIVNLKDNSIVLEAIFNVQGKADPKARLIVKGKPATLDLDGNFNVTVGVPVETSIIDFKAYDTDGNLQEAKITVNYITNSLEIDLTINSKTVFINSKEWPYELDVPPKLYDNRTFIPLRFLSETIGAEVNWYSSEKRVTYKKKNTLIELWVGKKIVRVNGKEIQIDAAPFIENGRTLVPLRFISEPLGAKVIWDEKEQSIQLNFSF